MLIEAALTASIALVLILLFSGTSPATGPSFGTEASATTRGDVSEEQTIAR